MAKVVFEDLPVSVRSFVKESDGYYTIVINARLSYEEQIRAYRHEAEHINREDFLADNLQIIELERHR